MKTVTIRELSANLYKCLNDLPLTVTKRGKPYLKVELFGNVATEGKVATSKVATSKVATSKNVATKPTAKPASKPAKPISGWGSYGTGKSK